MSKPQWLKDNEQSKEELGPDASMYHLCVDCKHLGEFVKMVKYRGTELTELYECDIHPGCLNTKYSCSCKDWICRS